MAINGTASYQNKAKGECFQLTITNRRRQKAKKKTLFLILSFISFLFTFYIYTLGISALPAEQIGKIESNAVQSNLDALVQQGRDYYEAGQFAQAVTAWEQAALSFTARQDGLNQAMVLSNLSLAYQHLGQWTPAKQAIAKSLDLLQTTTDTSLARSRILAQALNTQGTLDLALGQAEQALASWQQAEVAYRQANDEAGMLKSKINQAQALKSLGSYRRALATLTQVNQAQQKQPDSPLKAAGLRSLGSAFLLVGDLDQSQKALQQSLEVAQDLQLGRDIAATLYDLGNTARAKQDTKAALELYQQAAATATEPLVKIQAQLNQLKLLIETQKWSAAQTLLPLIQLQLDNLPPCRAAIYAQIDLGWSLVKLSALSHQVTAQNYQSSVLNTDSGLGTDTVAPPLKESAVLLATALKQAKSLGDQPAEAYALGHLGRLYEQTQQWAIAQDLTQQALLLAQAINAPDIAYQWQWQLGRLLKAQGNIQDAIAAYTEAVKVLQSLRSDLVAINPDVQFSFTESVEPVYRQLVSLLLQPGSTEPSQQNLAQARDVIESLQLVELDNFFREACLDMKPVQVDRIDSTAAVLYPIILSDRLEVIVSLPQQPLHHYATPISESQVERTFAQLLQGLTTRTRSEFLPVSQKVYDWLIRPAITDLTNSNVKTLVFTLDGSLRRIPMAALHDGKQYLIEKYNIALSPSLQLIDPKPLKRQRLKTLTLGITQGREGLAPLANVAREVEKIQSELPSVVLLDQAFTSNALREKIESSYFPVVHIATHGRFSSKAEETYILAWDKRIKVKEFDDILRFQNSSRVKAIELLVLSACQTAKGDKRATLGIAGMAVRAGARSTLATLWSVSDAGTADLMSVFYRKLIETTATKSEALRQAQLTLLGDPKYQHPYYWAPYVLIGNWL